MAEYLLVAVALALTLGFLWGYLAGVEDGRRRGEYFDPLG